MKFWKSWVIANKDFKIFRKKKRIIYSLIIIPLLISIGLPLIISTEKNIDPGDIMVFLNAFSFFYIILAYILPNTLSSYSIIGEKIEHSLEPLLATPLTDGELLFGKTIASFLPCVVMIYLGSIIFMFLTDFITYNNVGQIFFPNWNMAFILLCAVPLSSLLSIELNIIISSRVNDIRTANQLGIILFIPFIAMYILLVSNIVSLNILNLVVISLALLILDILLFFLSKIIFQRDRILTQWK
jgi:ABC-2 type transport system permease protein